jgi:hypothetical protein
VEVTFGILQPGQMLYGAITCARGRGGAWLVLAPIGIYPRGDEGVV